MLPQEESLAILAEFLHIHNCERVNGLSIDTIIELARVVFQANAFVYGKKFDRQIIGDAMGSAFILTLANIFMRKWERQTILPKLPSHELYGRYIDDVFFTSNESEDKAKELLEAANRFHPNIKFEYKTGKSTPFLDVLVQNNNGILASSVYHKPSAEPTVVSFLSDHPRHVFRNVIQTAFTRAVRYSSTFEVFNNERRAIRLMFLYNRYPSNYINQEFEKFFAYCMSSTSSPILPMITNESQFFVLRQKLSNQPTAKQTQVATSAAAVVLIQSTQNVTQQNTNNMEATARLKGLAQEIHITYDSHFKNTMHGDIGLVVGYRNNQNTEFELSRKRPSSSILKDPLKKKQKPNGVNATMDTNVEFQNLSISQELSKRKISNPLDIATSSDPTLLLPDYSKLSDSKFTQMLLTSTLNTINQSALIELLNQKEILLFIRQLTPLVNKLNYSQLQYEQWSDYYNLGVTEDQYELRLELDRRKTML
ncbi:unnamed protein product [Rotaria sordida]|uniref:Helix-turn-helix domain-containing protein n=1 Tax=Rotaria sordida TaxID=392033 RepID=A0A819M566_9BILA|nr:unnamed protein product [Rotaria sordida]